MRDIQDGQAEHGSEAAASIRLDGVHLELASAAGPVNILRGIDLAIGRGEVVSVVGPSGSGKSSMMMLIGGLERPTRGAITVAGHDLNAMDEDDLALFRRDHVGIVFQNFHLVPTMTALENVAIPLEFAGRDDAFDRAAAGLEAVGLGHRLTHYPGQLSGGEQQRTALARAFAASPDLILADEPTGNLDGETGQQVIDLMFRLSRDTGATLMLITHDPALAERCDRVVRLVDGRLVSTGEAGAGSNAGSDAGAAPAARAAAG
ncbi:MAG: ATP-binding cassette domain-containing protein [Alphaproteobacteria bacterium]|jgi:putative ABC transport system ATP-binding protein|nr:ATP-binding cassette domain-containing protein [Alphaproteobacteria bacterium]